MAGTETVTNILIIGNGFDLAFDMPTQYKNFLEFVKMFRIFNEHGKIDEIKETPIKQYLSKLYEDPIKNIYYIEHFKWLIKDNSWIEYFENNTTLIDQGWIDFESEIAKVIRALDDSRKMILETQIKGHGNQKAHIGQYQLDILLSFITRQSSEKIRAEDITFGEDMPLVRAQVMLNDLNRLTRALELYLAGIFKYLYSEQTTILQEKRIWKLISKLGIEKVLSFNYTDTYERLIQQRNRDYPSVEVCYIHGRARESHIDNTNCCTWLRLDEKSPDIMKKIYKSFEEDVEKCDLVLGIDEYLQGDERNIDNEFVQFKKFYQRILKQTDVQYSQWGNENDVHMNVYVYGHSLDVTDKDVLASFIGKIQTTTTVYYHSHRSHGNLISNLVKVINEDTLISFVKNGNLLFKNSIGE